MRLMISSKKQRQLNNNITQISKIKSQIRNSKLKNILPVKKYKISGKSMSPLLKPGNVVLTIQYLPIFLKPKTEDIIVCKSPGAGRILVKRITKIENNKYFVEGDNRTASTDSRQFGLIDKTDIIGKVIFVL